MSKSKSSSLSLCSCHCAVCAKPINDATEDSIFCEGVCKDWMHRTCAGLSKASARESPDDYLCHFCDNQCLKDEIKALKGKISSLEAKLNAAPSAPSIPTDPSAADPENPLSYSNVVKESRYSKTNNQHSHQQKDQIKYSVVVYGIKECPKGSSRLY